MKIIYELDKDGLHLQETILNLTNQGYDNIWNNFIEDMLSKSISETTNKMSIDYSKKLK